MKITTLSKLYILISILLPLFGCSEENKNNDGTTIKDWDTLTPSLPTLPDIEPPIEKPNYNIPSSNILSISDIERNYTDAYTLDDVTIQQLEAGQYTLFNNTPRFIHQPVLKINKSLYRLDAILSPFQKVHFLFNDNSNDVIDSIEFIDDQPFFLSYVNGYQDKVGNDEFSLPSIHNAYQFEQELRGYKNALNDFYFNLHFAEYISNYGTTRANHNLFIEELNCPYDHIHLPRSGNDSSTPNTKILSLLNHEPKATHHMLHKSGSTGLATIGSGWLSIYEPRLYQEGQQIPQTTYLHEKMHNHGFGHSGGMTYGLPDVLIDYMNEGGHFPNYYDSTKVNQQLPRATVLTEQHFDNGFIEFKFTFWSQNVVDNGAEDSIQHFMLVVSNDLEDVKVSVSESGVTRSLTPTRSLANNKVLVFENNLDIAISPFSAQQEVNDNHIIVRVPTPTTPQSFALIASGEQSSWGLQANKAIDINAGTTGLPTIDNQFVFYDMKSEFNESGIMEKALTKYTPEQGVKMCLDKGFSGLGVLHPYKSKEQMDFQMQYLPYESQVGLDPDTMLPVAVDVASSYRPQYTNYAESGALIVCK